MREQRGECDALIKVRAKRRRGVNQRLLELAQASVHQSGDAGRSEHLADRCRGEACVEMIRKAGFTIRKPPTKLDQSPPPVPQHRHAAEGLGFEHPEKCGVSL